MLTNYELDGTRYTTPVILVPGGCPQFLDFSGPKSLIKDISCAFEEWRSETDDKKYILHAFRPGKDDNGLYYDDLDPSIRYKKGYVVEGLEAIEPWLDTWLPLPFFRMRDQKWEDGSEERLEYGPTNWARGRISVDEQNPELLHLIIAFDMEVEDEESEIYASLRKEDVNINARFRLAWRYRDNAWFLDLPWVEEWLKEAWDGWRAANDDDQPARWAFGHISNYLVYLDCVKKLAAFWFSNSDNGDWAVQLINPAAQPVVNVDLVLDIGNSRTTGILVETMQGRTTQLSDGYLLQLRDLTKPEKIYAEPFDTRVEFCKVSFGNDALNKRSGRKNPAFVWPSPVRIGPEAARLSSLSRSGTGATGLSSPKRYLWDERDWKISWRFNTQTSDAPPVSEGPIAQLVNSSGTPLKMMEDPAVANKKPFVNQDEDPVFESFFTPSSLMMFLLMEIIHQALLTINSPAQRQRRGNVKDPRRLRQVIFTVPAVMPKAEQKIYKRWANWAVQVLWDALGWEEFYQVPTERYEPDRKIDYRDSPVVRCEWDEATCTQLVYIYNEITCKFLGDAALFCEVMGRRRTFGDSAHPSVRVATIDIGGGTTDLSITTFELVRESGGTPRMAPHPDFHDGFNIAGDDILHNIIRDRFLTAALKQAFENAGMSEDEADAELVRLFGADTMDNDEASRRGRAQFIRQIAVPVGYALIELYEQSNFLSDNAHVAFKIADCFEKEPVKGKQEKKKPEERRIVLKKLYPWPGKAAREYVSKGIRRPDFSVMDVEVIMDPADMTDTIQTTLGHILKQLCEVIHLYECDVVLLTGRPSRWDGIVNAVINFVPVPPARVMPMDRYIVDEWYPFRNTSNRITDPKTTVVVGAILCALAEGRLEGFSFDPRTLVSYSTARYIGQMNSNTDQITKDNVWFKVDPVKETVEPEEGKTIIFSSPLSVGFRQLEAERWTTNRYYYLEFANEEQSKRFGGKDLHLTIKLKLKPDAKGADKEEEEQSEGEFSIIGLEEPISGFKLDKPSKINDILELRLQTLPQKKGFWMDTGVIRLKRSD